MEDHPTLKADPAATVAREFALEPGLVYLNHAALGPWPQRTVNAVNAFARENGHSASRFWKRWYATEQRLRQRLARILAAPSASDIAILKNTSEGLSQIALGLQLPPDSRVAVLAEEFPSNLWPWQQVAKSRNYQVDRVERAAGQTVNEALMTACVPQTRVLAVSSVQWITGESADLKSLGQWCRERDIFLVVDAIQSLGAIRIDVDQCHIDALACGSHKWLLAPEGIGVLYLHPRLREKMTPSQWGWRMAEDPFLFDFNAADWSDDARRFECGTLNTLGIIGLDASVSLYEELGPRWVEQTVLARARRLYDGLADIGPVRLATAEKPASGIVSFSLDDPAATTHLYRRLAKAGILTALRGPWLRCSPHCHTRAEDLDGLLAMVAEAA